MGKALISVTGASRNFADCVNRAHYQQVAFVLLKNGSPVAQIVPPEPKACTGRELAEILGRVPLPAKEARNWPRNLEFARKRIKVPADK
jgi:antitoxin (DNA-binding transcriptional repressor) of toxin-antitoxin stability system